MRKYIAEIFQPKTKKEVLEKGEMFLQAKVFAHNFPPDHYTTADIESVFIEGWKAREKFKSPHQTQVDLEVTLDAPLLKS